MAVTKHSPDMAEEQDYLKKVVYISLVRVSLAVRSASVLKDLALCFAKKQSAPKQRCPEAPLFWCAFYSLTVP